MQKIILIILPFAFCLFTFSCSIPNLESNECQQARDPLKRFYSYHFGSGMQPSEKYYETRREYLTASFGNFVSKKITDKRDFFTLEQDYPKAFRVGGCETIEPNRVRFDVLLFWKDDLRSEQKKISVEMIKEDEKWLIDGVSRAAE
jgi:hypothetical protein